jgi:hypothetical protein
MRKELIFTGKGKRFKKDWFKRNDLAIFTDIYSERVKPLPGT